jgi:hypothetical protein
MAKDSRLAEKRRIYDKLLNHHSLFLIIPSITGKITCAALADAPVPGSGFYGVLPSR